MSEPKEAKMKLSERMRQNPIYDCIFDKYEGFHVSEEEIVEVEQLEAEIGDFRDRRDENFQMYEDCIAENIALKQGIQHLVAKTRKNVKAESER